MLLVLPSLLAYWIAPLTDVGGTYARLLSDTTTNISIIGEITNNTITYYADSTSGRIAVQCQFNEVGMTYDYVCIG